ncbi:pathogenesis-related family 1 protein [Spirulina sp. 06S082]|uniref:pathogenesis-related family 1 protein n=1 Tax=Spirulina sp. 06S082 TaxID=3110248 RepID=UPI002B1F013F|nr:pathogenesis-related family 1 protein [Spirulina sp. 06S082]MEA5468113.1 pathogenesis-related family 1 protein [Spirulina sp. 06S082]
MALQKVLIPLSILVLASLLRISATSQPSEKTLPDLRLSSENQSETHKTTSPTQPKNTLENNRETNLMAQSPTIPLDGSPVYVRKQGQWYEAILMGWQWNSSTGEQYEVSYVANNTTETRVTRDRILTLQEAQQRGIATNVYDLASQTGIEQMLNTHNQWRQKVGVSPLQWSPDLANYAQEWANKLLRENKFEHRQNSPYGENLASASGQQLSPERVVNMWGDEVKDYNYNNNSCKPNKMCGHYTQVVWNSTREVGCAVARNSDREVWVCNYNPPGNIVGRKPY